MDQLLLKGDKASGPGLEKQVFKQKIRFQGFFGFLGFNRQMPDTKLRPTSTMKSKDKSSEHRFGRMNATNRNLYLSIIFIKLFIYLLLNAKGHMATNMLKNI